MPKGSKKRKASKKKAHHHHNPNNHDDAPHSSHNNGDDEMKHHDDKESDGEEVNSPISQDNRNSQLDLTDGEKEEREKVDNRPHSPSSSDDSQSVDESAVHPEVVPVTVEAGGSGVDEELKPEEQSNGEAQNVEVVYNNSVSSQTQQPDDESAYNAVKATNELKEDKSTDVVVEPVKENGDEYLEKSSPFEKTAASEEEDPLISSYEAVNTLPEGLHPATDATPVEEKSDAVEENGSVSEVDKVALPDEKSIEDGIASGASVKIEDVTVPRTPGNGEKEVILLEKGVDTPPVDLGSQKEGDETDIVLPDGNLSASPLTEGNLTLSKNVTTSDVRNSAEQKKDIEVSESSVRQPLLAARPQPRTSWMNCCGLFEAFGGSSR